MKLKISVNRDKCIGAASCAAVAPATFELDDQEVAVVKDEPGDKPEKQLLAAQSCPVGAISVTNQDTGQQLWPKNE